MRRIIRFRWIVAVTFCWSWLVIAMGAFTRLTNSGLGCPDWPGCYGHLYVSQVMTPLAHFRAWAEMGHRYVAGMLVIGILASLVVVMINREHVKPLQWFFAGLLFLLLAYQPLLGMWTVTLKLHPLIVSQHLLSGLSLMLLIGLQWLYFYRAERRVIAVKSRVVASGWRPVSMRLCCLGALGILFLYLQLALGVWTSSNYAALSCDTFPFCHVSHWSYRFSEAFNILRPVGLNYDGGILSAAAKSTIQVVHRIVALFVFVYLLVLSIVVLNRSMSVPLVRTVLLMLALLATQICLGIANVLFARPLGIAIAHTVFASALLGAVVLLNFLLWSRRSRSLSAPGAPS